MTSDTQQYPVTDLGPAADPDLDPRFDQVQGAGGYHPKQVDSWIARILTRLHDAERQVAHFGHDAEQTLAKAAESPQATRLVADLMRMAAEELAGQKAEADQSAAQLRSDAEDAARQLLADAREEADKVAAGAREQAEIALEGARAEAKRMTDQAAAHSAAVSEGAAQRLQDMEGRLGEARRRMQQYHDTTGKILSADADRGTLGADVEQTLSAAGQPPLPATPSVAAVEAPPEIAPAEAPAAAG
jgi:hypothetical protein